MSAVNVLDAILTRRNIKQFRPDPVDMDKVLSWLQAASYAPNHRMEEPWEVRVIGPETRRKIGHRTDFGGAPLVLAMISKPGKTNLHRDEHVAAAACLILNFMLAAHAEGVGTGWSSIGMAKKVRELFQIEEGGEVLGCIPVGYPDVVPEPKERTPMQEKLTYMP